VSLSDVLSGAGKDAPVPSIAVDSGRLPVTEDSRDRSGEGAYRSVAGESSAQGHELPAADPLVQVLAEARRERRRSDQPEVAGAISVTLCADEVSP
jgi:hypothetical protein